MNKIVARLLCSAALFTPAAAMAQATASNFTSGTRYDKMHRVVGTIAPDPDGAGSLHHLAVRNTYDANGRLIRVEKGELAAWQSEAVAPASWSGFSLQQKVETDYDSLDRKVKETVWGWNAAGGAWAVAPTTVTQYSYDAVGRLECTAVRMDPALFGSLPTSACDQTSVSNPVDRISKNIYDAAGQLLQVRRAVGSSLEQAYVTYSYTPNGKQEYVVDANGNKALLTYDGYDRQATWQFPALSAPTGFNGSTPATALATAGAVNTSDREEYQYDLNGNRTKLVKRDRRSILFGYDALNRVTSKTFPDGGARGVYYAYDLRGLQTAARFDSATGADAVLSAWDGFGRQSSSTTNMGGTSRQISYDYDPDGNRVRIIYPDSHYVDYIRDGLDRFYYSQFDGTSLLFHTPYDAAGRVQALYRWNYATGAWTFGTSYAYDGVSRLASYEHSLAASAGVVTTLGYNSASQLVTHTRNNNDYRFTGYVSVDRGYATNGLNQYSSTDGAVFLYDANGNLKSDGTIGFTYDVENRLVSSTDGVELAYDPLGRLWQTSTGSTTGVTQFLYDGDALSAEYDGSGNMLKRYVHGTADGVDDPMVEYISISLSPRYLFADHQGSIIATADANGNRVGINSYDEYGIPSAGNSGRFQYTGQAWIPELGMYYYKARIYSPTLGRFLQTDPIGYKDQINLYAYVGNDPVNMKDPTGTSCTEGGSTGTILKTVSCKVDDWESFKRMKVSDAQIRQFEREYTRVVAKGLRNPKAFTTVRIAGREFEVYAGDLARRLMNTYVRGNKNNRNNATSYGGPMDTGQGTGDQLMRRNGGQPYTMSVGPSFFSTNRTNADWRTTIFHEGIHTTPEEKVMMGVSDWGNAHKREYDRAADRFDEKLP